ncbi:uncharacterized protein F4807DRAFT_189502 [Annulohypoxylon truncatum]|uniref:uncharacterized protein n=1 Tax=Annulohypoxylon truncatum TaxID=327061 RepID=UPI00200765C4|nr:uncharacterized protein F4807DRAFT_189502 [Annulohypoxylon truncatum]KAI1207167.1 hypothetical protein F4807DRAFT_189502 [Annulohypoxylon truncatum]
MDQANLAAAWLSFAATAVGLGGLISQASAINDQLDPYHANRTAEYLGIWFQRQQRFPWWRIAKPPPLGPVISAHMADGFCGVNVLHLARIPVVSPGRAGWSTILAMFNHEAPVLLPGMSGFVSDSDVEKGKGGARVEVGGVSPPKSAGSSASTATGEALDVGRSASWPQLERRALKRHQTYACIVISRTTLITMLVVTNGRPVFQYSDATGFRAGYASYCGQWYITWPIGQEAIVKFAAHDSIGSTEVLPRSFAQRVDRCGQMASGVVCSPSSTSTSFAVGFCGRKPGGDYRLEHAPKGFQGAHSGRHLYNMMGGKAFEVDFLDAREVSYIDPDFAAAVYNGYESGFLPSGTQGQRKAERDVVLNLPGKQDGRLTVRMLVPAPEARVLRQALDCLPWTSLSWSAHRGLRDVLLAFGKPIMDLHRAALADIVKRTVAERPDAFRARGWDAGFVRENMGLMGSSAVLAGRGNSGDAVRVVTDVVAAYVGDWDVGRLDDVVFWRREDVREVRELDKQAVVALTKLFVLEWSQEFDYQLYHHLPISLYFG